ncbi:hypothetical protein [Kordia jejudonensis]|uniref:hypothetical protein n=1 Tax=Kordia jejudonensis TaxID=1348245 RepID=UPI00062978F5|nr:hypothetical protein [Kordia jejudonensis]
MKKVITYIFVVFTFFACEEAQQNTREEATQNKEEFIAKNKLNIPKKGKLKELNATQKKLVQDWIEFKTINESMRLVNASSRFAIVEDLGQLAANIEAIKDKQFPDDLDKTQIRSRFLVLKTKALKLQDDAGDEAVTNEDISKKIVEMNRVFHAICYQIQEASEKGIDPREILGNSLPKDSTLVEKPTKEIFKSTITEKPKVQQKPKPKAKKVLQQQTTSEEENE